MLLASMTEYLTTKEAAELAGARVPADRVLRRRPAHHPQGLRLPCRGGPQSAVCGGTMTPDDEKAQREREERAYERGELAERMAA